MRKPSRAETQRSVTLALTFILWSVMTGSGLSPQVKYKWTKSLFGGAVGDGANDLTTDPSGNIYVTGVFSGTVDFGFDFGTSDIKTSAGLSDIFVTKIDRHGAYCWTRTMGGTLYDSGNGITDDLAGNIYVAGGFYGTVDFGLDFRVTDIKTSSHYENAFITKINSAGTYGWTRTIGGGIGASKCRDIAVDRSGNICLTGDFGGT